jgi:cytochrome c peroxidase
MPRTLEIAGGATERDNRNLRHTTMARASWDELGMMLGFVRVGRSCLVILVLIASAAPGAIQQEPIDPIPVSVPVDANRAAIGARLFHDVRLSHSATFSCATCHPLDRGGMDGLTVSNSDGAAHPRNTPTIFNASLNATFNWDGVADTLDDHADRTIANVMKMTWPELIARLGKDGAYASAFAAAYRDGVTRANVLDAIATFERSLVTPGARFDRYLAGDRQALTQRELEGYRLFKSYGCSSCHQGVNIGGNVFERFGVFGKGPPGGSTRDPDPGRFLITRVARDEHVFRVPSLRNVAITAPYFHDGRARTLADAVDTMGKAQLGRTLTTDDITLIVDFLRTLTGEYRDRPLSAPRPETP